MNKIIPILVIAVGLVALLFASNNNLGTNTSATNSTWSAYSYNVGTRNSNTEVISSSRGASFTTGSFSGAATFSSDVNTQDFVQGGGVLAIVESDGTSVITAAQICDYSVITYSGTATEAVASTTLPSDETLLQDCLTEIGDSKEVIFRNISIAASTTQLIAGDSITLLEPDGQNVVIAGQNSVILKFIRVAASNTLIVVDELIDAD